MDTQKLRVYNWPLALVIVVGLACLNIYPDLVGHGTAFSSSAQMVQSVTNGRVFFSLGLGSSAFLFALLPRRIAAHPEWEPVLVAICSVAVTIVYASCPSIGGVAGIVAGVFCAFGVGFGYGWLLVQLLCRLAESGSIAVVALASAASLLLKTVLDMLLGLLPGIVQVVVVACMPVACAACLIAAQRLPEVGGVPLDIAELPKCEGDNERVLFALLIMNAVLHAVTRSMSTLGFWGNGYIIAGVPSVTLVFSAVLLIAAVYYTMCDESNPNMLTRFLPAFLVLLGGFFVLDPQVASLLAMSDQITGVLTTVVELYAHTLYWVIIVTAIRNLGSHPYRLAGLPIAVMCVAAVILSLIFQTTFGVAEPVHLNSMVVMMAMYAFAVVVVVLFRGAKDDSMALTEEAAGDAGAEAHLQGLAASAGLSPRETEVFILLAQGRDRAFIKGELFISDATVKTHCKHIYAKLGVHNKQELISLVQEG